jgi:hypothetical protein
MGVHQTDEPIYSVHELGPGDVTMIPPGHKTWVIGNEPVVGIDFNHLEENTKQPLSR